MPRTIPLVVCAALVAAVPATAYAKPPLPEPDQGPDLRGLTLSGSGVARVERPRRPSEETIERAIETARPAAVRRAIGQARVRASALAAAGGLTLGGIEAVRGSDPGLEFGDVERYCTPRRRSHAPRCRVPDFTAATVAVTFATVQTSAATPAGRAIVASGTANAAIEPENRRSSPSITEAILAARLAAAPDALAGARREAQVTGRLAGMQPGALFSIAEVRPPFDQFALGSFGAGRFCGTVRRPVFRRDPVTGRQRIVRRIAQRRCFYPRFAPVTLRVTLLPR